MKRYKWIWFAPLLTVMLVCMASCGCRHGWGEWSVTLAPTCTTTGACERVCTSCGETERATLERTACEYDPESAEWEWVNYALVKVRLTCKNDPTHTAEKKATVKGEMIKEATCLEEGEKRYHATVLLGDRSLTDAKNVTLNPKGHAYDASAVTWLWSGYDAAEAVLKCIRGCSHEETVAASICVKTEFARCCTADGVLYHTATVEKNGKRFSVTQKEIQAATGHAWDTAVSISPPEGKEGEWHTLSCTACAASKTERVDCEHDYRVREYQKPLALREGKREEVCKACGGMVSEVLPATNVFKILAIGNSFSQDATEYLWNICHDAGIGTVIIGHLYIGGCSLDKHYNHIKNSKNEYTYFKNTSGKWNSTAACSIQTALADEEWDMITLQQASSYSGEPETYSHLREIVDILKEQAPDADLYWHLTWAYQQDSGHSAFPKYGRDQMTMYRAIVNAYQSEVAPMTEIVGMIPSGTAVQNLRTSYVGDTVTRDGHHMSYTHGRYLTALTWYAYLTGGSLEAVDWIPEKYQALADDLEVMREAVEDALTLPESVTQSEYTKEN